jgi:hypothetical protein
MGWLWMVMCWSAVVMAHPVHEARDRAMDVIRSHRRDRPTLSLDVRHQGYYMASHMDGFEYSYHEVIRRDVVYATLAVDVIFNHLHSNMEAQGVAVHVLQQWMAAVTAHELFLGHAQKFEYNREITPSCTLMMVSLTCALATEAQLLLLHLQEQDATWNQTALEQIYAQRADPFVVREFPLDKVLTPTPLPSECYLSNRKVRAMWQNYFEVHPVPRTACDESTAKVCAEVSYSWWDGLVSRMWTTRPGAAVTRTWLDSLQRHISMDASLDTTLTDMYRMCYQWQPGTFLLHTEVFRTMQQVTSGTPVSSIHFAQWVKRMVADYRPRVPLRQHITPIAVPHGDSPHRITQAYYVMPKTKATGPVR